MRLNDDTLRTRMVVAVMVADDHMKWTKMEVVAPMDDNDQWQCCWVDDNDALRCHNHWRLEVKASNDALRDRVAYHSNR